MVKIRDMATFVGVALPSLFMVLWSLDALLLVAEDVFLISALQVIFIAVYMWRSSED